MLVAMIALYLLHGEQTGSYSFALADLMQTRLTLTQEYLLFGGFMLAFAIKAPLVPFHTWLPDALSEAPAAGSIDLTGLLLKTGIYGMIRFAFPLFPQRRPGQPATPGGAGPGSDCSTPPGALIGRMTSSACSPTRRSPISAWWCSAWRPGRATAWQGSILLMVTHGIITGALFALVAMIRDPHRHPQPGGAWRAVGGRSGPVGLFLFFALASLGLPGLANFAGEILVLLGIFQHSTAVGAAGPPRAWWLPPPTCCAWCRESCGDRRRRAGRPWPT